jgi:(S)-ureidoglycine aminohydrolase
MTDRPTRHLGETRSTRARDHLLQTPDTFVRALLPGMRRATAIVHASPALGARFTQYTAEIESDGSIEPCEYQRFVYVLEGLVTIECETAQTLSAGGYAYLPSRAGARISSQTCSRLAVIEKEYISAEAEREPNLLARKEEEVAARAFLEDPAIKVRVLLPDQADFDFAVNTMTFQPGASLPMTEIHIMEHGLLMLEGGGIYRLSDRWYPVFAGDFIWIAPFCPQWFGALGKTPARYLIYKDWNRHPLASNEHSR